MPQKSTPPAPSTPLAALDAVVLDTETTGLDVRVARIVQIGAVRMHGAEILPDEGFVRLINPQIPIPPASSAVHGISDSHVREAASMAETFDSFEAYLGTAVIVGHTIAYDLEVLAREARLAGRKPRPYRALDIRLLAEVADLGTAQYSLDHIAGALGVPVDGRHTAPGDALITARIFAGLIPILRQRGIRTLAEAETVCLRRDRQRITATSGMMPSAPSAPQAASLPTGERAAVATDPLTAISRIDSFAFVHRVADVMSAPPVSVTAEASIAEAVSVMMAAKVSSVLVPGEADAVGARATGIVTERDVLRALSTGGSTALSGPVGVLATRPLKTIARDDFVYRAIGRMDRLGIRHLAVTDSDGGVCGMVSARNLLRLRASTALMLGDEIGNAAGERELGRAWAAVPLAARSLLAEGVTARDVAAIISAELCAITRRAAELAEATMRERGRGAPPVGYAVLVLGSAGRGESLLAADQDNAIVFDDGDPGGPADTWFAELATVMAATLDAAGIPFCKGGVMAKNPLWRHSLGHFEALVASWIHKKEPEDVLNVDIFFDGVPVHGDLALGERVFAAAHQAASASRPFQAQLAALAGRWQPPLTLLGGLRQDEDGRIDLKKFGLLPIFTAGRLLAIRYGDRARSTPSRLRAVVANGHGDKDEIESLIEAHGTILAAMLDQQIADVAAGVPLSPRVHLPRLSRERRNAVRDAIRRVQTAADLVAEGRL